jgi:hypothetical protein
MKTPILFLIRPDSRMDRPEGWYCPDCALVEGVLAAYPQLRAAIDVRHVDFARPRQPIIDLVGEGAQDCPCLLLDPAIGSDDPELSRTPTLNGWRVVTENLKLLLDTLPLLAAGVGRTGQGSIFAPR